MKNKNVALSMPMNPYWVQMTYVRPLFNSMVWIGKSSDAEKVMRCFVHQSRVDLDYKECFWVMLLSRSNRVLGISRISEGNDTGVMVSIKEILQLSILSHSSCIILVHNHPSGNLKFSKSDIILTEKIQKALELFDIVLLDHLVISSESYSSSMDSGATELHSSIKSSLS